MRVAGSALDMLVLTGLLFMLGVQLIRYVRGDAGFGAVYSVRVRGRACGLLPKSDCTHVFSEQSGALEQRCHRRTRVRNLLTPRSQASPCPLQAPSKCKLTCV